MFYTTLNRIREWRPCYEGWKKLLKHLGKREADDEPLSLLAILESNGLDDAIWALRAIDDCPEIRLFAVRCARQVQHLLTDRWSRAALDIAEWYAVGEATIDELEEAMEWARDSMLYLPEYPVDVDVSITVYSGAKAAARMGTRGIASAREIQRRDFIDIFCSPDTPNVSKR